MRIYEILSPIPSPLYHGTSARFDRFELGRSIRPQTSLGGFSFTTNPNTAYSYAVSAVRTTGGKARVVIANVVMNNPLDITSDIAKGRRKGMAFTDAKRMALEKFNPTVHDGIVFRGNAHNPDEYVVFDPDQIQIIGSR
jgi:hypothetical protein